MSLLDAKGRRITYLRLSVTDRCNLRCTYCMPAVGFPRVPRAEVLRIEEAARVARIFASLGVDAVRITGGEPTVRAGLVELVGQVAGTPGIRDVAMTTNADRMRALAGPLREAGLTRINVSLDSLDPERFRRLTRGGRLDRVLDGVEASLQAGLTVKLNTVVIRGQNDDELEALCDYAWERGMTPRFIELMPVGEAGRMHGREAVVPAAEILERLAHRLSPETVQGAVPGTGPADYRPRRDRPEQVVGVIGAVTARFCEGCNRVRVTARGELRGCLARPEGVDLRALLRGGASDAHVAEAIREAVFGRRDGHEFWDDGDDAEQVVMTGVGG